MCSQRKVKEVESSYLLVHCCKLQLFWEVEHKSSAVRHPPKEVESPFCQEWARRSHSLWYALPQLAGMHSVSASNINPSAAWFYLFIFKNKFIYLFIFGCVGSSLLCAGFLWLRRAGATLRCGVRASHCRGFSCCRARALGAQASVVVARGLSSCGLWALELRLSSCGARALLLHGMWDLPGPGLEPMSFALAGRFLTTVPTGKPSSLILDGPIKKQALSCWHLYVTQMIQTASMMFSQFQAPPRGILNLQWSQSQSPVHWAYACLQFSTVHSDAEATHSRQYQVLV